MKEHIEKVRNLMNGYKTSFLLIVAAKMGIFDVLATSSDTSNNIGAIIGVDRHKIELMLNALVGLGLISKKDDYYMLDEFKDVLDSNSLYNQMGYFNYAFSMAEEWKDLETAMKNEVNSEKLLKGEHDEKKTREFMEAMNTNAILQAMYMVDKYDFSNQYILDVGAGYGTYSIIIAKEFSNVKIDVFDLPVVCKILNENIGKERLKMQIRVIEGDYKKTLPDSSHDTIFLFSVIHQENEDEVRKLLKKTYNNLGKGGKLYLSSYFLEDNKVEPYFSVLFGIEMLIKYGAGKVYTHKEIILMLKDAGYKEIIRDNNIPGPATLYIATK